jgi:hypothetical protein
MKDSVNEWQIELEKTFDLFAQHDSLKFIAHKLVSIDYDCQTEKKFSCLSLLEAAMSNCKQNKPDAMNIVNSSLKKYQTISIDKTLDLLTKLHGLYMREYQQRDAAMSWKSKLEDLFDAYVHQNSLEYAASYMAEYSSGNLGTHKEHTCLLETAMLDCQKNGTGAMEAINKGGGYMPQSIEEALRLLTELYELYLLEYEKQSQP